MNTFKKILSVFLSALLILAIIPVNVFAEEKQVTGIEYAPVNGKITVYEDYTSGGSISNSNVSYRYYIPDLFKSDLEGSVLTLKYSDGSSADYTLTHIAEVKTMFVIDREQERLNEYFAYTDAEGNELSNRIEVDYEAQADNPFAAGKENELSVLYRIYGEDETLEFRTTVPVEFIEKPESIVFKPARTPEYISSPDENLRSGGYTQYMDGSVLTVKNKDGSTYDLTCKLFIDYSRENYYDDIYRLEKHGYYFVDKNGDVFPVEPYFYQAQKKDGAYYGQISFWNLDYSYPLKDRTNEIKSVKFTPARPIVLTEGVDGDSRDYDFVNYGDARSIETPEWFRYDYALYETGNKITVTFKNGDVKNYTFYRIREYGWDIAIKTDYRYYLIDENGDTAIYNAMMWTDEQHYETPWKVGKNYVTLTYGSASCSVPVEVKYNPEKHTLHVWNSGKVTKAATYTATGVKTYTCTACGKTRTEKIAKLKAPAVAQVKSLKSAKQTTNEITLTWAKAKNAKKYIVYRSTDGKTWKKIDTTTKLTYTNKKLSAGKTYQYKVRGVHSDSGTKGKFSTVLKTGTLTAAPTVTLKSSNSKTATATWKKVTGAKKYVIFESANNKKWTKVTTTTKLTYTLSKLSGGKKIYVKVAAVNAYGKNSAYSKVKSVTVKK